MQPTDRKWGADMDRLSFSRRARRRARRQRVKRIAFVVSVLGTITGLPGATFALDALERLAPTRPARVELRGIEASESIASTTRFRREVFERRPRNQPPSTSDAEGAGAEGAEETAPASGGSISEIISSAAAEFGLDGGYLLSVASCESGLDPSAVNAVGYYGLFQFDETTWAAYGYGSIYDPVAQARTAARLLAAGHTSRWPNCA
jgi:soluble lytic murein transglycosylase-like protein